MSRYLPFVALLLIVGLIIGFVVWIAPTKPMSLPPCQCKPLDDPKPCKCGDIPAGYKCAKVKGCDCDFTEIEEEVRQMDADYFTRHQQQDKAIKEMRKELAELRAEHKKLSATFMATVNARSVNYHKLALRVEHLETWWECADLATWQPEGYYLVLPRRKKE